MLETSQGQLGKLSEDEIKALKDRVLDLRRDNEMRNLDKDIESEARMDVKAIREEFQAKFPAYLQKELEMDKLRQDMNRKYVEMHLIMDKHLIEPEQEQTSFSNNKVNLYNLLKSQDDPLMPTSGTYDDLNR